MTTGQDSFLCRKNIILITRSDYVVPNEPKIINNQVELKFFRKSWNSSFMTVPNAQSMTLLHWMDSKCCCQFWKRIQSTASDTSQGEFGRAGSEMRLIGTSSSRYKENRWYFIIRMPFTKFENDQSIFRRQTSVQRWSCVEWRTQKIAGNTESHHFCFRVVILASFPPNSFVKCTILLGYFKFLWQYLSNKIYQQVSDFEFYLVKLSSLIVLKYSWPPNLCYKMTHALIQKQKIVTSASLRTSNKIENTDNLRMHSNWIWI